MGNSAGKEVPEQLAGIVGTWQGKGLVMSVSPSSARLEFMTRSGEKSVVKGAVSKWELHHSYARFALRQLGGVAQSEDFVIDELPTEDTFTHKVTMRVCGIALTKVASPRP